MRNDGTFPGKNKGEILVYQGEKGVVIDHGYFLQDILIYTVYFESGVMVGCLERELDRFQTGGEIYAPVYG
ncbi:nitrogen fixation protein NifZ [Tepidibacillus marianensis]|uniref:nitrogen fixation protein NifZ n=1 Tax=Tepidibacillus marianensis TaxID=3131995 RepID=UPI0030CBE945